MYFIITVLFIDIVSRRWDAARCPGLTPLIGERVQVLRRTSAIAALVLFDYQGVSVLALLFGGVLGACRNLEIVAAEMVTLNGCGCENRIL